MAEEQSDQSGVSAGSATGSLTDPIHGAILETLASAVIALEDGVVTYFNEAAANLTGLNPDTVVGNTFAEVFLSLEGAGEFAEAVLAAVYEGSMVRQRVVNVTFPSGKQVLSVSVSRTKRDESSTEDGNSLAVVFEDLSEIIELREKELSLAKEVESQHAELREAYVELEERSRHLADAQGKTRVARTAGAASVVLFLVMLVLWVATGSTDTSVPRPTAIASGSEEFRTLVVEPQPLTTVVNVIGRLGPRREVEVTSPISGKIALVHVPYGTQVEMGQTLLELDVTEVQIQQRDAEATFIKARERQLEVENWTESVEASRARRGVTKARIDLADSQRRLDETVFLRGRGVIPAAEQEAAERDHRSRQLDLEAAEQDLAVILEKGKSDRKVAELELENATARLAEIEQTLALAVIKAPIGGVVMRPPNTSSSNRESVTLVVGRPVGIGEHLLTIGDVEGLSVIGRVDEVDVVQIRPGNRVRVSGDAFPGVILHASIGRVSSEAIMSSDSRSLPYFETVALIDTLTPEQASALRIGMSVSMEVVVREDNEVLLIPVEAVEIVGGETLVSVVEGEDVNLVAVSTGVTTLNSVEITNGLKLGDEIRVPVQ